MCQASRRRRMWRSSWYSSTAGCCSWLAVAIIAGIALRLAAAAAALLLLQIVVTLAVTGGLTDLTLRDVGVLGLALCLTGNTRQRATING
jgi:hypothetical protein